MNDVTHTFELDSQSTEAKINYHIARSKRKGDYHFRQAELLGADGDYIPGKDDGEPLKDYR